MVAPDCPGVASIYLAFACVSGDDAALRAFERAFLGDVGAFIAGVERAPASARFSSLV